MARNFSFMLYAPLACLLSIGCGGDNPGVGPTDGGGKADGSAADGSADGGAPDAEPEAGNTHGFEVAPSGALTLTVDLADDAPPTLTFTATHDGDAVTAGWSVDRAEVGSVEAGSDGTAVFTPTGAVGGRVVVRATFGGATIEREIWVELVSAPQNGPDPNSTAQQQQIPADVSDLTASGGVGGVGGEGLGTEVDAAVRDLFDAAPTRDGSAENLRWLYPYDGTVWPRGMLAPLLMWESDLGGVDAIQIELRTTAGSFAWSGVFGPPAILADPLSPNKDFIRHPIPQDAWERATNSAGGTTPQGKPERLEVTLTLAKDGETYGPLKQTWTIAPARLSGTIYYASYGTNLAKNSGQGIGGPAAVGGDGTFGGAVLSIRVGDTGPQLAAGGDGNTNECRVCHSVAADGSRLTTENGLGGPSSAYDIDNMGITETTLPFTVAYPALTADGRYLLAEDGTVRDMNAMGTPTVTVAGLSAVTGNVGTPTFSYDDSRVVFNPMTVPTPRATRELVVMDVDIDRANDTLTFSNPQTIVDNSGSSNDELRPGWPSFTPEGNVVFHQQIERGNEGGTQGDLHTRRGAKAYLAWTPSDEANPVPLDALNGIDGSGNSYLPELASPVMLTCTADGTTVGNIDTRHEDDANLNYEPTVNPVASGGYAWVIFTSRRRYGSFATIPPFCSDPRGVDLIQNVTTKKLWVAALDLNGTPGEDISHPAFYLPAQEMLAGNTRGSWVLDPCRPDGDSCETGDMCCGGFCSEDDDGALVCGSVPDQTCSGLQERCESAADCCEPTHACLNNFCTYVSLE